jgi:hypothetical protein
MPTYQAKKNGNRYQHYSRALGAQASRRLSLEREIGEPWRATSAWTTRHDQDDHAHERPAL